MTDFININTNNSKELKTFAFNLGNIDTLIFGVVVPSKSVPFPPDVDDRLAKAISKALNDQKIPIERMISLSQSVVQSGDLVISGYYWNYSQ